VLDNLSSLVSLNAANRGIELLFDTAPNVPRALVGDPLRLGQVLVNLANNAVKFTESGEIVIKTELVREQANRVLLKFSVRDTGIGMPPDQMDTLFESFSQADSSTTRKYGGSGLGLAICKRLVEIMHGDINVESKLNKGSTFTFTAEFGRQAVQEAPLSAVMPDLRGMRVLVVDDNASSRTILSEMLHALSFDVTRVDSGPAALTALTQPEPVPYNLVLLDWKMPGMDGIEVAQQILQKLRLPHMPAIIMLTAYGREEIRQQAVHVGVDAFLSKPVTPSMLFDTIMHVFGKDVRRTSCRTNQKPPEIQPSHRLDGANILLVEDNLINQQIARELFENAGCHIDIANNGREAVERIVDCKFEILDLYDAILMDIQMPEMDGYEATRRIRETKSKISNLQSTIPIIAMTAHALSGEREKCLMAGMDDYVTKPIDPDELFTVLLKWVKPCQLSMNNEQVSVNKKVTEGHDQQLGRDDWSLLIEHLPGIDVEAGLKRVAGNQPLYRKLLMQFVEDHREAANHIRGALANENIEAARRLAHAIKGVAGNMGAAPLLEAARDLEVALKNRVITDNIEPLLEHFDAVLDHVIEGIELLQGISASQERPEPALENVADMEHVQSGLTELAKLLGNGDADALGAVQKLQSDLSSTGVALQFSHLERFIENYDFEEALSALKTLARFLNIVIY
jgi:CheY-like chemotaxis protein